MTSMIAKFVAKRILGERLENNYGKDDPYFETVPATRLDGRPSSKKGKKRPKALPPGISEQDGKVLTKVKRRAYRLDMSLFNCCGIAFGWSSVIGIIPVVGDVLDAFMALMVLRTCQQVEGGLPKDVNAKMMFNIIVDFGIGLVPFLGDIADALFRANTKNAIVLEEYLRKKGEKNLLEQGRQPPRDPSDPEIFDDQVRDELSPPPKYTTRPNTSLPVYTTRPNTSMPNETPRSDNRQREEVVAPPTRSGWFGGRPKQTDEEQAHERNEVRKDSARREQAGRSSRR
ncbi:hypothetical protein HYFRA_00009332 [Hymenoscyphus fraxineus]|uniref:PH domain-containing protein n=1 Tax=Hymenoscyphus fraxineus TaxID=746836 RepID=A0A9N9KZV2_9HELO|nr:hypothetical protein HYFRA_00009332 [Hymenoscyphus fraxineus]